MEKVQTWMQAMQVPPNVVPSTAPGLEALYSKCRQIYPDQTNPLQVSALLKYWLGGPDPLDYISMYSNSGNAEDNIPPHWHYISFGLTDLHGDNRVHEAKGRDQPSGFGFELTFRLKREPGETAPPTWPASLMQALAKYVFQSGNLLCAGDHVSWHCALDNSESRIQHMLMTTDPQLDRVETPLGTVHFIQIVGVCEEELRCAQRWNGPGVIEILKRLPGTGGSWLVSDMRRGESMLDLDCTIQDEVERGIESEGSNLSGVSACCSWLETEVDFINIGQKEDADSVEALEDASLKTDNQGRDGDNNPAFHVSEEERMRIKAELFKGLRSSHTGANPALSNNPARQYDDITNSSRNFFGFSTSAGRAGREPAELCRQRYLECVHLTFNLESGLLLPLAIRGRVMHGRHFTFKSVLGDVAITLVSPSVTGILVDNDRPYAAQGSWLQMLLPDELAEDMANTFHNVDEMKLPKTFVWKNHKLTITILPDGKPTGVS